jgi:hypothetical protein
MVSGGGGRKASPDSKKTELRKGAEGSGGRGRRGRHRLNFHPTMCVVLVEGEHVSKDLARKVHANKHSIIP